METNGLLKTMHKEIQTNRIFARLDRIEDKAGKMVHEIPELAENLKRWQDGKLSGVYFLEQLNKFLDEMEA